MGHASYGGELGEDQDRAAVCDRPSRCRRDAMRREQGNSRAARRGRASRRGPSLGAMFGHRTLRFEPLEDRRLLSVSLGDFVWQDLNGSGSTAAPSVMGTYAGPASFAGATNHTATQGSPGTFSTAMAATTTTTILALPSPSVYGQSVTFTATVMAGLRRGDRRHGRFPRGRQRSGRRRSAGRRRPCQLLRSRPSRSRPVRTPLPPSTTAPISTRPAPARRASP